MTFAEGVGLAVEGGLAAGVLGFLRAMLPELRALRRELTAVEKHLAAAGQRSVHVEGAIVAGFDRLGDGLREVGKDTSFLVSLAQAREGRSTRPAEPPEGGF